MRFPASGTYILRLSATDGELTSSDEVVADVRQPGAVEIFERRVSLTILGQAADSRRIRARVRGP